MSLGEFLTIGAVNHGQMGIGWHHCTQRFENINLPWRVVDMVIAPDHMANLHIPIVDYDTEVISGRAICARDDEIIELFV